MFKSKVSTLFAALVLCSCTSAGIDSLSVGSTQLSLDATEKGLKFGDRKPIDWGAKKPSNYPVHGIDISKWQGEIDWLTARKAGVSFAFIKATEGGDHTDARFAQNWIEARRARLPVGAYHFYYFCTSAAEQAEWFIRHVPKSKNALPPVLDMEWNHDSKTCKKKPHPVTVRNEMRVFLERLAKHYGQKPIIYVTVDFYKDNQLDQFKGYEYWLRSVADHPSKVYPNQAWSFWQYTGTGKVPGVEGDTDINTFAGSVSQWKDWLEKNLR